MRWCILLLALSATAFAASWTVRNPTGQTYVNEAIRLHLPVPVAPFTVTQDGTAVMASMPSSPVSLA
jgi:hypothetical protein